MTNGENGFADFEDQNIKSLDLILILDIITNRSFGGYRSEETIC